LDSSGQTEFRPTTFLPRDIEVERRSDGCVLLRCRAPLTLRAENMLAFLRRQASEKPDAPWISQRVEDRSGWRSVTFAEARTTIDRLAQGLIDLDLPKGRSLVVLSENSIEHALLTYACFQVGIAVVPVTPAYALQSPTALQERLAVVGAGAVFAQDGARYADALDRFAPDVRVISVAPRADHPHDIDFAALAACTPGEAVEQAYRLIDIDAPARYMFTSGSSGQPKAVIQTQRNLLVAVESNLATFGQTGGMGIVRLDWMPWSHVTGAAVLAATLVSGGRFYIDDGRPVGADFTRTLDNLREVSPTNYFSMPAGYVMLVEALENDAELAACFFENLLTMGYGGARMPDDVAKRMQDLAIHHTGYKIPFTCGYGSTETGPGGAMVYWPTDRVGLIGLPQPGYDMKLVPIDDERFEVRVRSEAVSPGYLEQPEATARMRDGDGYFCMGDAAAFQSPDDPLQGLVFAGRLSDEFKLVSGTFVRTNELTDSLLERTAPLLQHIVLCGEGEQYLAMLAWLNLPAARALARAPGASREVLNRDPQVRAELSAALARHNAVNSSSSRALRRFLLQDEEPDPAQGELADKGSIRAGDVRRRRAVEVKRLFATNPVPEVVEIGARRGENAARSPASTVS